MRKSLWIVLSIWGITIVGTLFYGARYLWLKHEAHVQDILGGNDWGPHGLNQRVEAIATLPHLHNWFIGFLAISVVTLAFLAIYKRSNMRTPS